MKNLDNLIIDKIFELINYTFSKIINPDIKVDEVTQIDEKMIDKFKEMYGIEGIILDLDDTLRKNMGKIPKCNEEWLENVKRKMKVIIVSNGSDNDMARFLSLKGIDYIGIAHKPLKKNFKWACQQMKLEPEKVLVIGDRLFSDIYGGKRNNMKTVLVNKVVDESER